MLIAMAVGMVVLEPVWALTFDALAWSGVLDRLDVHAMVMASDMSIPMVLWMRLRSGTWAGSGRMSASMFAPFSVLLVPFWAGAVSGDAMFVAAHVLMLPCMAFALVRSHRVGQAGPPAGQG
ncbi:MAG TPA: hypothetical protein VHO00_11420 [Actinomycetes bacterium]|nr:hypothetical protein [Actinomycetes bacterium]